MYCLNVHTLIVTADRSAVLGDGLTYDTQHCVPGTLMRVPLRKRWVDGIVIGAAPVSDAGMNIRSAGEPVHADPLLPEACVRTAQWVARHYRCSVRQALGLFLPFTPWTALLPQRVRMLSATTKTGAPRGTTQKIVLDALRSRAARAADEIHAETGASAATIRSLLNGGWITEDRQDVPVVPPPALPAHTIALTPLQTQARDAILAAQRPSLLFGVTGSGKTEIYADLVYRAAEEGRQAILLVPEIFLTEHITSRFRALLGDEAVAVVHSKRTPSERRDIWRKCRSGEIRLVIGSRSALFVPMPRLSLVIIDEEHEWTYKSEQTPRYHARDTAEELCRHAGARLVLGSATPSVEAWQRAQSGQYALARLPQRYGSVPAPTVRIIDLTDVQFGSSYPFSGPLLDAIGKRLAAHEQSVLFLNRRGVASALLCLDCRRRLVSIRSGMPYTVHKTCEGTLTLIDHTSGDSRDVPERCPGCQSPRLHAVGAGTHRAEAILRERFPHARVLRADSDTLSTPQAMRETLGAMREGTADILIGTQSVVKGLDLPGVTLAAVLVADIGLSIPQFRAGERVFQLIAQLVGRSGRHQPGEVIIQTFRPDSEEIRRAAAQETELYLQTELKLREQFGYPPATDMVRFLFDGPDARRKADALHDALFRRIAETQSASLCSRAPSLFGIGQWHVLLRGTDIDALMDGVPTDARIDRDPLECC